MTQSQVAIYLSKLETEEIKYMSLQTKNITPTSRAFLV